jgi:hypothetical protein
MRATIKAWWNRLVHPLDDVEDNFEQDETSPVVPEDAYVPGEDTYKLYVKDSLK